MEAVNSLAQPEYFDAFATKVVVPDSNAASYELQGIEAANKFPYRAVVSVIGTPSLRPDMPVYFEGLGTVYSGFWTVLAAEHKVIEESTNVFKYVTVLTVGTDSLGTSTVSPVSPNTNNTRKLNVSKRNVPVNPTSTLIARNPSPNDANATEFNVTKANRTTTANYTIPYWAGSAMDLATTTTDTRLSPAAFTRLGLRNVV